MKRLALDNMIVCVPEVGDYVTDGKNTAKCVKVFERKGETLYRVNDGVIFIDFGLDVFVKGKLKYGGKESYEEGSE